MTRIHVVNEVNPNWSEYDKIVGKAQLMNYGKIYVDSFGCPIDNEYDLEELEDND